MVNGGGARTNFLQLIRQYLRTNMKNLHSRKLGDSFVTRACLVREVDLGRMASLRFDRFPGLLIAQNGPEREAALQDPIDQSISRCNAFGENFAVDR